MPELTPIEWGLLICFIACILIILGAFLPYLFLEKPLLRVQYGDLLIEARTQAEMEKAFEAFTTYKSLGIPTRRRNMRPIVTASEN